MGTERSVEKPPEPAPEGPTDLTKRSWMYVVRKTAREFVDDQCTDLAAALTYYAVLATFPPNVRYVDRFRAAQQRAREAGVGLWSACPAG